MDRDKIIAWTAVTLCIFLIVLPRIVPVCTGLDAAGNPMKCHYTYQAEFLVTLLALILAGSLFVLRTPEARMLAGALLFLLGIIILVLPQPWASGICFRGMACEKTKFFTVAGGILLSLTGAIIAWLEKQKNQI